MPLIDGIGDEVTHFFIAFCLTIVLTIAWWTTNTSEQRNVHAVVLLEHRRQRRSQQLTNHTESATISEGNNSSNSVTTTRESVSTDDTVLENKPPEAGTSDERREVLSETNAAEEAERIAIVETMDTGTCELRQRRLAFYENRKDNPSAPQNNESNLSTNETANSSGQDQLDERNYNEQNTEIPEIAEGQSRTDESVIRIKLKYINDDLKLVDGKLQEQLGNFKRRHFEGELSANKLVRLIFNGQVLQQDNATLENCGLFDNCVVHCLVHPRRNNTSEETNTNIHNERFSRNGNRTPQTNNQVREWDLGNLLFALISFILGSAWYFRYVYAHLYTITATVALVAVTGIFTIVLIGMYFPEQEPVQRRPEPAHS